MPGEYTAPVRRLLNLWTVPKRHLYNAFNAPNATREQQRERRQPTPVVLKGSLNSALGKGLVLGCIQFD